MSSEFAKRLSLDEFVKLFSSSDLTYSILTEDTIGEITEYTHTDLSEVPFGEYTEFMDKMEKAWLEKKGS